MQKEKLLKLWQDTDDLPKLYSQLTDMQKCFESFLPLTGYHEKETRDYFDTLYTYESNKIEGNTLTHQETRFVINEDRIIEGKTLVEHQEAKNHAHGIQVMREMVEEGKIINLENIQKLHLVILSGINTECAGRWRNEIIRVVGSDYSFPIPFDIPKLMDDFLSFYEANRLSMHPVELAANIHEKFVTIHPFIDGNGRTARLLMNFILLGNGYPMTIISADEDKLEYYKALNEAQTSKTKDNTQFQIFVAKAVKKMLLEYLHICTNSKTIGDGKYFFDRTSQAE